MNGYNKGFGDGYVLAAASGSGGSVEPLSVTENGTYTAESGGYSPVTVDVKGDEKQKAILAGITVFSPVNVPTITLQNKSTAREVSLLSIA